jgi:hypothetical protein
MKPYVSTPVARVLLVGLWVVLLAACGGEEGAATATPETPQTPVSEATATPETPQTPVSEATATPAEGETAVVTLVVTATPVPPTAVPTDTPTPTNTPTPSNTPTPTATPTPFVDVQREVLLEVGTDWSIAANSDINGDGKAEIVAYSASGMAPSSAFAGPAYAGYDLVASGLVVAQRGDDDGVRFMLRVAPGGVTVDGIQVTSFSPGAAALLVQRLGAQIAVIPLNSAGEGYTSGVVLDWVPGAAAYQVSGDVDVPSAEPTALPTEEPTPTTEAEYPPPDGDGDGDGDGEETPTEAEPEPTVSGAETPTEAEPEPTVSGAETPEAELMVEETPTEAEPTVSAEQTPAP